MKNIDLTENKLFQELKNLPLLSNEYVIFGSGVMFAVGIRPLEDLDDIDIFVNEKGWDKVKHLGEIELFQKWGIENIQLFGGKIEVCNGWGPGEYVFSELLKRSIKVSGFNFASVEDTIRWKKEMGREKDLKHVKMLEDYLADH